MIGDLSRPEARVKAGELIAWLRAEGVKEYTDEHGRKLVLDLNFKKAQKPKGE